MADGQESRDQRYRSQMYDFLDSDLGKMLLFALAVGVVIVFVLAGFRVI